MDKQDLPKLTDGDTADKKVPWQALDFEKVPARDAEASEAPGEDGMVGGIYS